MNTTKKPKTDFRIKYTDAIGNVRFITRTSGKVAHFAGNLTPHALSNVAGDNAALLSFALADAVNASDAAKAIRELAKYAKTVEVM